jgi:exosortase
MSVPASKYLWRALPIAVAVVFAYSTVLVKLSRDWWYDENYSHGLLIPFIIGYILWLQRDKFATTKLEPSLILGGTAVVLGLFGLWAGVAGAELYTQRMSLVLLLAGTVVYFWGFRLLKLILVPFALLVLSIPIPTIIFNKIAFPLQLFASRCAVWSMRTCGSPAPRFVRSSCC